MSSVPPPRIENQRRLIAGGRRDAVCDRRRNRLLQQHQFMLDAQPLRRYRRLPGACSEPNAAGTVITAELRIRRTSWG